MLQRFHSGPINDKSSHRWENMSPYRNVVNNFARAHYKVYKIYSVCAFFLIAELAVTFKSYLQYFISRIRVKVMAEQSAAVLAKAKPKHPKYTEMVEEAIKFFNEKGGSSRQAITKYIKGKHQVGENANTQIKLALVKSVSKGRLVQTKGAGASGSFKISKELKEEQKKEEKKRLKKEKKALKEAAKENISPDSDNDGETRKTKAKKPKKKATEGAEKKKTKNTKEKSSASKAAKSSKDSVAKKSKPTKKKSKDEHADSTGEEGNEKKLKKSSAKAKSNKKPSPGKKAKSAKSKDATKAPKPKKTAEVKPKKKKALAPKN